MSHDNVRKNDLSFFLYNRSYGDSVFYHEKLFLGDLFVQESKIILIQNDWIGNKASRDLQTEQYLKAINND